MILAEKLMLGSDSGKLSKPYVEFVSSTAMTITPQYTNSGVTLQYSLDGTSWTTISSGATTPSANVIYFRGQAIGTKSLFTSNGASNAWTFTGASNLEVYGKLDRLIQNALGDDKNISSIGNYCYSYMFYNNSSLIYVTAPSLPATTLANYCYQSMFLGCTSLTVPPSLPATTLATNCYHTMFRDCTSLTTAPSLPATTLANYCYQSMFLGCTSLTVPPSLPATTLATNCYHTMFRDCTSLTTAPRLPATTLANYCYYVMFGNCTSLKLSTTLTGIYDTPYRIPTTGTGKNGISSLANMFYNTGGTFTGTPNINTTYYTENTPV